MCFAVCTDKAGAINRKHDVGVMPANIMHDLIVSPLHECGINGIDRLHPFHSQRCTHRSRMLLGDADINHPPRETLPELNEAGASRHGRRYRNNPLILFCQLDQRLAEYIGIRRIAHRFEQLPRLDFIRCRNAVPLV
ncbi:hypothetical protein D3C77_542480 [compost metagenome]